MEVAFAVVAKDLEKKPGKENERYGRTWEEALHQVHHQGLECWREAGKQEYFCDRNLNSLG